MEQPRCRDASHVFWILDGGTIHRGQRAVERLQSQWNNLVVVHLSIHARWLNQVETHAGILQRRAVSLPDLASRERMAERILGFHHRDQEIAAPLDWRFTRDGLHRLMERCDASTLETAA